MDIRSRFTGKKLASALGAISYAEAHEFCMDLRRGIALRTPEMTVDLIIEDELKLWAGRMAVAANQSGDATGAGQTTPKTSRSKKRRATNA